MELRASLFDSGVEILEQQTGSHCLGVFPMAHDIELDPEDGVSIEDAAPPTRPDFRVALIRLPHISNFTDFRLLAPFAQWLTRPKEGRYDCIVLPGTKNTLGDLEWLRATGLAAWIVDQALAAKGKAPVGGVANIYTLANSSNYSAAFFDVMKGDNLKYQAGSGWDFVTGWGTPNFDKIATALGA